MDVIISAQTFLESVIISSKSLWKENLEDTGIERALGILWNPRKDSLKIKVSKREVPLEKSGM